MRPTDIDKVIEDQKAIESRKKTLIEELLKEKAAAIKEFDDKLAKLGYVDGAKPKRTHHKKPAAGKPQAPVTQAAKPAPEKEKPRG
jgi:hypothetical protein